LLSIARLNIAKSRVRLSSCNFARIDQMCPGRNGGLAPVSLPLFHASRRGLAFGNEELLLSVVGLLLRDFPAYDEGRQLADFAAASEVDLP